MALFHVNVAGARYLPDELRQGPRDAFDFRWRASGAAFSVVNSCSDHPDAPKAAEDAADKAAASALHLAPRLALQTTGLPHADPDIDYPEPSLVGAVVRWTAEEISYAWTGNVRVYARHGNDLTQLTVDHTAGQRMRDEPGWRPDGYEDQDRDWDDCMLTTIPRSALHPGEIGTGSLPSADAVIVVSGSVGKALSLDRINTVLAEYSNPGESSVRLVDLAMEHGARKAAVVVARPIRPDEILPGDLLSPRVR